MDSNQQIQPQSDYPLRGRPQPGQRPNRTAAEREMMLAARNQTEMAKRQEETQQTASKKTGMAGGIAKKALPLLIGGTAVSTWGIFEFLL